MTLIRWWAYLKMTNNKVSLIKKIHKISISKTSFWRKIQKRLKILVVLRQRDKTNSPKRKTSYWVLEKSILQSRTSKSIYTGFRMACQIWTFCIRSRRKFYSYTKNGKKTLLRLRGSIKIKQLKLMMYLSRSKALSQKSRMKADKKNEKIFRLNQACSFTK